MENEKQKLIPNSTQVPNLVLDKLLPHIPEAEMRCILYICRRTFGFQKKSDDISLGQFTNGLRTKEGDILDSGAGIKGKTTAIRALGNLEKAGAISVKRKSKKGRKASNTYTLNLSMDIEKVIETIQKLRNDQRDWKPKKNRLFPMPMRKKNGIGSGTLNDSTTNDTTNSTTNETIDSTTNETYKTKGNKEKQSIMQPAKKPSAHQSFIEFFHKVCQGARGMKPVITGKDGKNLQRVLAMNILSQQELEQLALYFLGSWHFKKFSPSISTFLSAGILTGLINTMKQGGDFWKELDGLSQRYAQIGENKVAVEHKNDLVNRLAELKAQLGKKLSI